MRELFFRVAAAKAACVAAKEALLAVKTRLLQWADKASSECKQGLFAGRGVRCCVSRGCAVGISLFLGIAPFVQSG